MLLDHKLIKHIEASSRTGPDADWARCRLGSIQTGIDRDWTDASGNPEIVYDTLDIITI